MKSNRSREICLSALVRASLERGGISGKIGWRLGVETTDLLAFRMRLTQRLEDPKILIFETVDHPLDSVFHQHRACSAHRIGLSLAEIAKGRGGIQALLEWGLVVHHEEHEGTRRGCFFSSCPSFRGMDLF